MESRNKITVTRNKDKKMYGISFPLTYDEKDLQKVNYSFIKYVGIRKVIEEDVETNKHFVEFVNFPESFIQDIYLLIKEDIDQLNKGNKSISEIFKHITNLFNKHRFNNREEKIFFGDLGEALFILKVKEELGVDISKYYRSNENLYDFFIEKKNYSMEVKSCTKSNGNVIINKRQLEESSKRDFYIVEYQFIPGNKSILDIYREIGFDNLIIKEKYDKWLYWSTKQEMCDFIKKDKTVDIDKVLCFRLSEDLLPKMIINNDKAIVDIDITLNVSFSRNEKLDKLYSILKMN